MENKMTVVAKDGRAEVLVGSAFHELKDESCMVYETGDVVSFAEYLKQVSSDNAVLFYGKHGAAAFRLPITKKSCPIAKLELAYGAKLRRVLETANLWKDTREFLEFLKSTASAAGTDGRDLIRHVENLKIKKIENIEQKKDNRGNFHYQVITESGAEDMEPPVSVRFCVPVYEHIDDAFAVSFDVWFDYVRVKEAVSSSWRIENADFKEALEARAKEIVYERLKTTGLPLFYGVGSVVQADNSWMYLANPVA